MKNLYAVKVYTGFCGCDNYHYIICEAGQEEDCAYNEMESNAESFYEEDDGDYDEYMEDCGYHVALVAENFIGSYEDAEKQYGCPSEFV